MSGAILRGLTVFLVVASIGLAAALLVFVFADPGTSIGGALKLGALYLGPFHHVAVTVEGDLDVDVLSLPGSDLPAEGSVSVEIGVALLAVTALAGWLLYRAGTASARGRKGGPLAHALAGARVAIGYAPFVLLVAVLVTFEDRVTVGSFVSGEVRASLSPSQALAFPSLIAAVAGAAGGLRAWVGGHPDDPWAIRSGAVLGGGWRMFALGLAFAYVGLLVAGAVQPDEPVASLTPSTARYVRTVFGSPGPGSVVLGHHLALAPNEAVWTLVPASGGCDVVRGGEDRDVVCFGAFPVATDGGELAFGDAPSGYLLFLLVPALATFLGGRVTATRAGARGSIALACAAGAGAVYAALVGVGSLLAGISLSYGATAGAQGQRGGLWIGPEPVTATVLALAWGILGGALGAASVGFRRTGAERPPGRGSARR